MGTWGSTLYSDDLAAELRDEFRDLVAGGSSPEAAVDQLEIDYSGSTRDPDEAPVFWLAVAHTAWRLGRPVARATEEALRVIATGADLRRWEDAKSQRQRLAVLRRLEAELRSQPPAAKRLRPRVIATNNWVAGEVVAFRLTSGLWTVFRVIGHHVDKGGRHAVCEPLAWLATNLPEERSIANLPLRPSSKSWEASQFLLAEPRRKQDVQRFVRIGVHSAPVQTPDRYLVFGFPHFDRQLEEHFGVS